MEKEKKYECDMTVVLIAYWIIVLLGKVIRYTILKDTLVNMSIGNGWLGRLSSGSNHFIFNLKGESVASENSIALFQIFRFVGLTNYVDYEFAISIIWNIIFFNILLSLKNKISIFNMFFLIMSIAVLNIWDFCLAKEPLQMLYFLIIYFILISTKIKEKYKFGLALLVILLSCFTFRNYYIMILAFSTLTYVFIEKYLLKKEKITSLDLIKILIAFAIIYILVILYSKNFNTEAYNSFIYFNKRVTKAKTDLSWTFHSDNLFIMSIDYIILVLRMLFPIEILSLGIKYWFYAIYQVMISIITIKSLLNIKNNNKIKMYAIYVYIGFLFTSATFEPDFGSWVRHEAVLVPIIIIMADLLEEKKTEKTELGESSNE